MGQLPPNAWRWIALIVFLFAPGSMIAYLTHSAIWMFIAPGIFVVLMIVFVVLLS